MDFAKRLRLCLEERHITRAQFAKMAGYEDRSSVTFLLQGKQLPTVPRLKRIADILGVSIDYLLCRSNTKRPINVQDVILDMKVRCNSCKKDSCDKCEWKNAINLLWKYVEEEQ